MRRRPPRALCHRFAPANIALAALAGLASLAGLTALATTARADGAGTTTTTDGWEQVSDAHGIRVLRRSVAGSNLKEFQGRGLVEAPVGRVLAVLRDADHHVEWMPACAEARVIETDDARRVHISYQRLDAPWPVSDRDAVNRAELRVEPALHRVYIAFEAISDPRVPPRPGVVRMPRLRGHWILIPRNKGQWTEVEYQVHADPGGRLPDWLANLTSKKLPDETLRGLRAQVKRRQYPAFEAQVARSDELRLMVAAGID